MVAGGYTELSQPLYSFPKEQLQYSPLKNHGSTKTAEKRVDRNSSSMWQEIDPCRQALAN